MKKDYWKVVDEEYPGGIICEDKVIAMEMSRDTRSCGLKAYVRKVRMTEEENEALGELDY